jgi:Ca2+-binding RTX toxin-like protein
MRRTLTLVLTVPALWLVPGAAHAAGTCQGQAATIESTGGTVTGTEGADVILASGFATIDALGGNDTICGVGGSITAGAGDDSITVTPIFATYFVKADLGPGVNHYVSTGEMNDSVTSGVVGQPDTDVVDLGPGGDDLDLTLAAGSNVTATAGPATQFPDSMTVHSAPGDAAAWQLQLPATLSRAGVPVGSFAGFGRVTLSLGTQAAASVAGTDGPDMVAVAAGKVDADLGAGHDFLQLSRFFGVVPTEGSLDLGRGKDELSIDAQGHVDLDLRKGTSGHLRIAGVERAYLAARHVDYVGSRRSDTVYAIGCHVALRGGPGNDLLYKAGEDTAPSRPPCRQYRFHIFGQGGNDRMMAWTGRDVLVGGPGRDHADGGGNIDVCRAEVLKRCDP